MAKIMAVWIFGAASGFLPIASAELDPIFPMASAGPKTPMAMAAATAINLMLDKSMVMILFLFFPTFNVLPRGRSPTR
jgi:hypothetical protein